MIHNLLLCTLLCAGQCTVDGIVALQRLLITLLLRFKSLLGKEEAVRQFLDGDGELLAARSWVPFYSDGLALVAYLAWMENRLNGERTAITLFTETRGELWFYGQLQRRIYALSGHLKQQIDADEYRELIEAVWRDRARAGGWQLECRYEEEDTALVFTQEAV